jgi:hypothetical protein
MDGTVAPRRFQFCELDLRRSQRGHAAVDHDLGSSDEARLGASAQQSGISGGALADKRYVFIGALPTLNSL